MLKILSTMPLANPSLQKPHCEEIFPYLTNLPRLTPWRRLARSILRSILRLLMWIFIDIDLKGMENYPSQGAALIVSNHLGDLDAPIGIAVSPRPLDLISKAELYNFPIIGKLMDVYGVIWIHRGQPDRRALRAALQGLAEGRIVAIAPEGRESLSGALEAGNHGAAYLALKADVPIYPITFIGTENQKIYRKMRCLQRSHVAVAIGPAFRLQRPIDRHIALKQGTEAIMRTLANQLPPEYRGVYQVKLE